MVAFGPHPRSANRGPRVRWQSPRGHRPAEPAETPWSASTPAFRPTHPASVSHRGSPVATGFGHIRSDTQMPVVGWLLGHFRSDRRGCGSGPPRNSSTMVTARSKVARMVKTSLRDRLLRDRSVERGADADFQDVEHRCDDCSRNSGREHRMRNSGRFRSCRFCLDCKLHRFEFQRSRRDANSLERVLGVRRRGHGIVWIGAVQHPWPRNIAGDLDHRTSDL